MSPTISQRRQTTQDKTKKKKRERERERERESARAPEHPVSRQARRTATADRTDKRFIGSQKPLLRTVFERGD